MSKNIYFHNIEDNRGNHIKYFSNPKDFNVTEAYITVNKKDVVRGFHRSGTQNKLVQVLSGKARVVVLTKDGFMIYPELSNQDSCIYVPIGSYLGYRALEENTIINYLAEGVYSKDEDFAIHPFSIMNDPKYTWGNISDTKDYIISDRDLSAPLVEKIEDLFEK